MQTKCILEFDLSNRNILCVDTISVRRVHHIWATSLMQTNGIQNPDYTGIAIKFRQTFCVLVLKMRLIGSYHHLGLILSFRVLRVFAPRRHPVICHVPFLPCRWMFGKRNINFVQASSVGASICMYTRTVRTRALVLNLADSFWTCDRIIWTRGLKWDNFLSFLSVALCNAMLSDKKWLRLKWGSYRKANGFDVE